MRKQVILALNAIETVARAVETEFSEEDIQEAVDKIFDKLIVTDDGWNEDKIFNALEKAGYIKIGKEKPKVYNILLAE